MSDAWNGFVAALRDPVAQEARSLFARETAQCLTECGNVLWAFGLPSTAHRRALALVTQMAGALATSAASNLSGDNLYAASALTRQLVEVEYLLFLFSEEPAEAERWLSASPEDLRRAYTPATMRKRSAGRFRDGEYWSHCDLGGHPNPRAHILLPDNVHPEGHLLSVIKEAGWADLGQHLERAWGFFARSALHEELSDVGIVARWALRMPSVVLQWHRSDPCADRLPPELIGGSSNEV